MAGRRSVKIRRGHSAAAQRKRRAYIRISTARPCQGRSARVRRYRLWTRREAWPQTGQQASGAFGAVVMVTVSADGTTCWTSRPEGISGRMCLDKPVTGSTGCSCYVRIPHRFAHQRHQDCGRAQGRPRQGGKLSGPIAACSASSRVRVGSRSGVWRRADLHGPAPTVVS